MCCVIYCFLFPLPLSFRLKQPKSKEGRPLPPKKKGSVPLSSFSFSLEASKGEEQASKGEEPSQVNASASAGAIAKQDALNLSIKDEAAALTESLEALHLAAAAASSNSSEADEVSGSATMDSTSSMEALLPLPPLNMGLQSVVPPVPIQSLEESPGVSFYISPIQMAQMFGHLPPTEMPPVMQMPPPQLPNMPMPPMHMPPRMMQPMHMPPGMMQPMHMPPRMMQPMHMPPRLVQMPPRLMQMPPRLMQVPPRMMQPMQMPPSQGMMQPMQMPPPQGIMQPMQMPPRPTWPSPPNQMQAVQMGNVAQLSGTVNYASFHQLSGGVVTAPSEKPNVTDGSEAAKEDPSKPSVEQGESAESKGSGSDKENSSAAVDQPSSLVDKAKTSDTVKQSLTEFLQQSAEDSDHSDTEPIIDQASSDAANGSKSNPGNQGEVSLLHKSLPALPPHFKTSESLPPKMPMVSKKLALSRRLEKASRPAKLSSDEADLVELVNKILSVSEEVARVVKALKKEAGSYSRQTSTSTPLTETPQEAAYAYVKAMKPLQFGEPISLCLSVCLSVSLSVCLSVCLYYNLSVSICQS